MPIHEKSLIRPENIVEHESLEIDGIDVSGHWSTFIESRVVNDYNEAMEEEVAALPGGEYIHRCWQCGSCTNACTVNALNADFNPRYWIYLTRIGMEQELLRDKDLIWQCVSCNKCTYACPRDVNPEGGIQRNHRRPISTKNLRNKFSKRAKSRKAGLLGASLRARSNP
jgi:heterodisulfide reductase subunit C